MANYSENNKRVAKNTLFLYLRMFLILIVTLYTSRVVLKVLGVEDYGISNVVGGVISMVSFISTSVANGFQRFFNIALGEGDEDKLRKYFSASMSVELILSIICLVIAETVGLWFVNTQLTIPAERMVAANWVYQCAIITFILALFKAPYNAIVVAYEKMDIYAYVSIFEAVGKLLVAFAIQIVLFDKLIAYSLLHLALSFIVWYAFVFFARKCNKSLSSKPYFEKTIVLDMLSFSGWNLFGTMAHTLKGNGLNIVLNMFFTPAVNAARGVAYQVSASIMQFSRSFLTASRPQVVKYYAQKDYSAMTTLTNSISRYSFLLLWILSMPLIGNMDFIMKLWLGEGMPELAPKFCTIVLFTSLIETFSAPIATLVHASGKMKTFQIVVSSVIMLVIPLAYIVLKLGGSPESALYVSLFVVILAQIVRLILIRKIVPFSIKSYLKDNIMPCALVVGVSMVASFLLSLVFYRERSSVLFSFIDIVVSFIVLMVIVFFIGLNNQERQFVLNKITNVSTIWKRKR